MSISMFKVLPEDIYKECESFIAMNGNPRDAEAILYDVDKELEENSNIDIYYINRDEDGDIVLLSKIITCGDLPVLFHVVIDDDNAKLSDMTSLLKTIRGEMDAKDFKDNGIVYVAKKLTEEREKLFSEVKLNLMLSHYLMEGNAKELNFKWFDKDVIAEFGLTIEINANEDEYGAQYSIFLYKDKDVVGEAHAMPYTDSNCYFIHDVFLVEEFRNNHIGRYLVEKLIKETCKQETVKLHVDSEKEVARSMYLDMGLKDIDTLCEYEIEV